MRHATTCDLLVKHGACSCRVEDYGLAAHLAALAHLEACHEALDAEEAGVDDVQSPASAPFCGCEDCQVRETLHAAFPILLAGIKGQSDHVRDVSLG